MLNVKVIESKTCVKRLSSTGASSPLAERRDDILDYKEKRNAQGMYGLVL